MTGVRTSVRYRDPRGRNVLIDTGIHVFVEKGLICKYIRTHTLFFAPWCRMWEADGRLLRLYRCHPHVRHLILPASPLGAVEREWVRSGAMPAVPRRLHLELTSPVIPRKARDDV